MPLKEFSNNQVPPLIMEYPNPLIFVIFIKVSLHNCNIKLKLSPNIF